jgi:type IV secretion system protein VirB3|tara:strand:- start:28320 stop:28643 length:324 start_codon:yes stop_codon:yes gene_type:complete
MSEGELIQVDPLFVGLTRPATLYGIPYFAAVIEFMTVVIFFLAVGNPLVLLVAIPVHAVLYLVSATDHDFFNSLSLWMNTNALCRSRNYWGAASFSPLADKQRKDRL